MEASHHVEATRLPDIAVLERTASRAATALIDACLRHDPTQQRDVSDALSALKVRDAPAVVGGGGRLKLIVKWRSEVAYVWAYGMLAIPGRKQAVILLGRQWFHDLPNGRRIRIPSGGSGEEFVNAYAGGQLFLPCGASPQFQESAIVTDSENAADDIRHLPGMRGSINALDIDTGMHVRLPVGQFLFEDDPDAESVEPDIDYLCTADAESLRLAIKRYKEAPSGVFRPDRIELSGPGRRLINSFLFVFFRNQYAKSAMVNFSILLKEKPTRKDDFTIKTTDHYIARSEKWIKNDKSDLYFTYVVVYNYHELLAKPISCAGLEQQLKDLVDRHGFQHVAQVLSGIAPPGQSALVTGMASSAKSETGSRGGKSAVVLPELPDGLVWPVERFSDSKNAGMTIIAFLEDTAWPKIIKAGFGRLRYLRHIDPSALEGIKSFERVDKITRKRRRMPAHLHFDREAEVNDRKIASGEYRTDPKVATALADRLRRDLKAPSVK